MGFSFVLNNPVLGEGGSDSIGPAISVGFEIGFDALG